MLSSVKLKKSVINEDKKTGKSGIKAKTRLEKEVKLLKWIVYAITILAAAVSYLVLGWKIEVLLISLSSFLLTMLVGAIITAIFNLMCR